MEDVYTSAQQKIIEHLQTKLAKERDAALLLFEQDQDLQEKFDSVEVIVSNFKKSSNPELYFGFLARQYLIGRPIADKLDETFGLEFFQRQMDHNIQNMMLAPAVYGLFQNSGETIVGQLCKILFATDEIVVRKAALRNLNYLAIQHPEYINAGLSEDMEKVGEMIQSEDAELKVLIIDLVVTVGMAKELFHVIQDEGLSNLKGKHQIDYRKWFQNILREMKGEFEEEEKTFGKWTVIINSRSQKLKYELAVSVLGDQFQQAVLQQNSLKHYLDGRQGYQNAYAIEKQNKKQLKLDKKILKEQNYE